MSRLVVGFAGLSHLGIVAAVAAAAKGMSVVAYDPDAALAVDIEAGRLPVSEPGLAEHLQEYRDRVKFSAEASALAACDVVYIAADVPTDARYASDLSGISALIAGVVPVVSGDAVLVILSQVPVGFTRSIRFPVSRLFYQVETLVFGQALERAIEPERFIVGCADPDEPLPAAYADLLGRFGCPILPMQYESAELCKMAINCFLAASVTVTNTLAGLSERVGADWSEIAPALKLDRRIGPYAYLAPGLGLAGGHLERDLANVILLGQETGTDTRIIAAFIHSSGLRRDWALRVLHEEVLARTPDPTIAVLGLAYKADTDSTKHSAAFGLLEQLGPWPVRVFDPVVPAAAAPHRGAVGAESAIEAASGADVVVVMTPWSEFRDLQPADLAAVMRGRTLLDPYRVIEARRATAAGLDYFTLGRSPKRAEVPAC